MGNIQPISLLLPDFAIESHSMLHHVTAGEYSLAVGNGVELHVACGSLLRNGRVPEAILRLDEAEAILQQQNLTLLAAAVSRRRGELEGESGLFESRSPTRS